jgi:hypothetical protein
MNVRIGSPVILLDAGGFEMARGYVEDLRITRITPSVESLINQAMRIGGPVDPGDEIYDAIEVKLNGKWYGGSGMQSVNDLVIAYGRGRTARAVLTRRRHQVEYRRMVKAGQTPAAGETIIGGVLFCGSAAGRQGWIDRLAKLGFNSFVTFRDVQSPWALQFGWADWVRDGNISIQ